MARSCTAAYLKNRTLANACEFKTSFEIFFGKKPNFKHLKMNGSKVFVLVTENNRSSKCGSKAKIGILVGYEKLGYRVLINSNIQIVKHVKIIEQDEYCIGLNIHNERNDKKKILR